MLHFCSASKADSKPLNPVSGTQQKLVNGTQGRPKAIWNHLVVLLTDVTDHPQLHATDTQMTAFWSIPCTPGCQNSSCYVVITGILSIQLQHKHPRHSVLSFSTTALQNPIKSGQTNLILHFIRVISLVFNSIQGKTNQN